MALADLVKCLWFICFIKHSFTQLERNGLILDAVDDQKGVTVLFQRF